MTQPILGSLQWMNQSMRTVNPVFNASQSPNFFALTSATTGTANELLTNNNGAVLTNKPVTYTTVDNLVRWM